MHEALYSSQIAQALNSDPSIAPYFRGVFPCDKLPIVEQYPCAAVANTDPAGEPGEHWVCFYFDHNGTAEYFDSYGLPPTNFDLLEYFLKNSDNHRYKCNEKQLQGTNSDVCGHYCIAFLAKRCAGQPMENIINEFKGRRPGVNDKEIARMVKETYNIDKKDQRGGSVVCKFEQCCCSRACKHSF